MALQQALDVGMVQTEQQLAHLAGLVRSGLARVPGVTVRDRGRRLCAICSFTKVDFLLVAGTGPSLGPSSASSPHASASPVVDGAVFVAYRSNVRLSPDPLRQTRSQTSAPTPVCRRGAAQRTSRPPWQRAASTPGSHRRRARCWTSSGAACSRLGADPFDVASAVPHVTRWPHDCRACHAGEAFAVAHACGSILFVCCTRALVCICAAHDLVQAANCLVYKGSAYAANLLVTSNAHDLHAVTCCKALLSSLLRRLCRSSASRRMYTTRRQR